KRDCWDALDELEKEWTPERLKEYVLARMRERYQRTAKYVQQLELENKDARMRGVSYKDRTSFTAKIKTGLEVLRQYTQEGKEAKRKTYRIRDMVVPLD